MGSPERGFLSVSVKCFAESGVKRNNRPRDRVELASFFMFYQLVTERSWRSRNERFSATRKYYQTL